MDDNQFQNNRIQHYDPYQNIPILARDSLSASDSLAVRAILDRNGLYNTTVRSVSSVINDNGQITYLSIYHKQITFLPPEIGQLTSLEGLYFNNNQLTSIPPEIGKLKSLNRLEIADNKLT
jgi:Leucine-rich repeat (LRR) protein